MRPRLKIPTKEKASPAPLAPLPPEPEDLIDIEEAAKVLGMTKTALYQRIYKGEEIPVVRVGRLLRFTRSALAAWRESNPPPTTRAQVESRRLAKATEKGNSTP